MKLALLFALVAAAAVLSHSAPALLDADATNSDTEQVDSMLTDLMAEVASKSTEDVQVGNANVYGPVNIIKVVGPTAQTGGGSIQSNTNPITGNPVPDTGAGHLVAPGTTGYGLHDHRMVGRIPTAERAFLTYTFASRVKVTKAVIVQHQNGVDEIELFSGSTSCGTSKGVARSNGQQTSPGAALQEHVLYDYTFSANCPPGTEFKIQVRTITCTCGWAIYRMYPLAVAAPRTEDIGNRHEEIHKSDGIIDLIDKMLSKVVATVATFSVKKDDAQINLDKEQKTFNAAKDNAKVATDEYIASSSQAEKEKQMIYQIRAMVIRLNQGKATLEFENCRDAKAAGETKSGVYELNVKGQKFKAYCDMTTAGGGWTLAMRTQKSGDSFNYMSPHWTTNTVMNDMNLADGGFDNSEAKFTAFNVVSHSEILIKHSSGRFSQLGQSRVTTLLDLFKGPVTRLDVISGEQAPQRLMSDGASKVCGAAWRTNSGGASGLHKVRLGGYFSHTWSCDYGNDSGGNPTSAEQAGLGLWDNHWAPMRTTGRDAGVRQAHGHNSAPGGGQNTESVTMWVR